MLLLEYLLWLLGRLCSLPSISLSPQACCWHLGTLCHHTAEGDTSLSGCYPGKRPESRRSCICKLDFVFFFLSTCTDLLPVLVPSSSLKRAQHHRGCGGKTGCMVLLGQGCCHWDISKYKWKMGMHLFWICCGLWGQGGWWKESYRTQSNQFAMDIWWVTSQRAGKYSCLILPSKPRQSCVFLTAVSENKQVQPSCRAASSWQAASCQLLLLMEACSWTEDRCLLLAHRSLKATQLLCQPPHDGGSCALAICLAFSSKCIPHLCLLMLFSHTRCLAITGCVPTVRSLSLQK